MKSAWTAAILAVTVFGAGCVDPDAARDAYVLPEPDTMVTDTAPDTTPEADVDPDGSGLDGHGANLAPESASLATLWSGGALWSAPLAAGATLVVATDGTWRWIDAAGERPVVGEGELALPAGAPAAAITLGDGTALVAVGATLLRLDDGVLGTTPLSDALGGARITALATPDGEALWIATDAGLWRWRNDALTAVSTGPLPAAGALLVCGAPVGGREGVWVAAGGQVYALSEGAEGLDLWPEQPTLEAAALGVDDGGLLWVVSVDGDVRVRTPDAIWRDVPFPEPVVSVAARRDSAHVWLAGAEGRLFHAVGDALSEVANAPGGELAATPGSDGAALLAGPDGVVQVAPGRVVALLGANPGAALAQTTTVTIRTSEPGAVEQVDAWLDGMAITATASGPMDQRVWQVEVDPVTLINGHHAIHVEVSWPDATLSADLTFEVAFPTWADDVEPLYARRCSACHDAVIGAATAVLDDMPAWTSQIDCIICRVTAPFDPDAPACMVCESAPSSMPPTGPLPDREIDLVRQWRAGGLRP